MNAGDRLSAAIGSRGPLCVGLDPDPARTPGDLAGLAPAEAVERFCLGVIDAAAGHAAAVKPQSACFERLGAEGFAVLERVCARARAAGLLVVLDAKRGDIGVTAERYADAAFNVFGADFVTLNAYMGEDAVLPFLDERYEGRGVFVLVRTTNPGADET